jgi:hypothetical protein
MNGFMRPAVFVTGAFLIGLLSTSRAQSGTFTIEINQAIGVQKNNALKFVAGKDTVVRAIMSAPVTVDPAATSATVTRDGAPVATLQPNTYNNATGFVDF